MQCVFEVSASGISFINFMIPKLNHHSLCHIQILSSYKMSFFPKFLIVFTSCCLSASSSLTTEFNCTYLFRYV